MEILKPIQIRIQFRRTINLTKASYEHKLQNKFKFNPNKLEEYTKKKNVNISNYLFYEYLRDIKYREALNHYRDEIYSKNEYINDITKVLLLFFPHLIKSNNVKLTEIHTQLDYFKWKKLKFEDPSQVFLEETIKNFFENYAQLEQRKIMFHRHEMTNYLECFLNIYADKEKDLILEEDKKDLFLYHHFRPFIRPEDYFTMSAIEKDKQF